MLVGRQQIHVSITIIALQASVVTIITERRTVANMGESLNLQKYYDCP